MEQFSKDLSCEELPVKRKHKATSMHLITLHQQIQLRYSKFTL